MTVAAIGIIQVSDLYRVFEWHSIQDRHRSFPLLMADRCMADFAISPDHLSLRAHVLTVMTTEAAIRVVVADIVRVGLPVNFHTREEASPENSLYLFHCLRDSFLPLFILIWIGGLVEGYKLCAYLLCCLLCRGVRLRECFYGLLFDVGQGMIESPCE